MLNRIVRSRYYIPALIALVIGTEAYSQHSVDSRISNLEAQCKVPPVYKDSEDSAHAFANKLRLCELACFGQVKKFSESTDTCECVEKPLD